MLHSIPLGILRPASYNIPYSAVFNGTTGYLHFTPGSSTATDRKLVFAGWFKRPTAGAKQVLFAAESGGTGPDKIEFTSGNKLRVRLDGVGDVSTTNTFSSTTAWYHVCVIIDLDQATNTDRIKTYVDGTLEANGAAYATQSNFTHFKKTIEHRIGRGTSSDGNAYFSGSHADTHVTDGEANAIGDFIVDGLPIEYVGAFGTNGSYLKYSNSGNLGEDFSGNGNNWTVVGGVTQSTTTPTNP